MVEEVILVNEQDEEVGQMEKMEAHQKALLHRAFSVFIFNSKEEMLLQQRAIKKYHSGGLWTNACCSHPKPGESTKNGAERRLSEELGFTTALEKIFHFTYKHRFDNGLTEFEFDHVFIGHYDGKIIPEKEEASDYCFMSLDAIESSLNSHPQKFTPWFHIVLPLLKNWMRDRDSKNKVSIS
jgi:isopentenyl-diphosphate Delta-isomerase